jgi:hypothetical protein
MTDYYPQEEGAIFDSGAYIIPCRPDDTISEMSSVTVGTTVAGRISVLASAATGDGIGIALKASTAAGTPSRIPVLFYGICKVTGSAIANYYLVAGSFAMNNLTTTFLAHQTIAYNATVAGGGGSHIMGLCLQGPSGPGGAHEVLLLVGKTS